MSPNPRWLIPLAKVQYAGLQLIVHEDLSSRRQPSIVIRRMRSANASGRIGLVWRRGYPKGHELALLGIGTEQSAKRHRLGYDGKSVACASLALAVVQRDTLALRNDVGFQRSHLRIIGRRTARRGKLARNLPRRCAGRRYYCTL